LTGLIGSHPGNRENTQQNLEIHQIAEQKRKISQMALCGFCMVAGVCGRSLSFAA
jgi:hypothetical protein